MRFYVIAIHNVNDFPLFRPILLYYLLCYLEHKQNQHQNLMPKVMDIIPNTKTIMSAL